jgi:hypothetical protein
MLEKLVDEAEVQVHWSQQFVYVRLSRGLR